jgi:hypothetical protein
VRPLLTERTIHGVLQMLEYDRDRRPHDPRELMDIFSRVKIDPFRHTVPELEG